jgi:hypothetical protein
LSPRVDDCSGSGGARSGPRHIRKDRLETTAEFDQRVQQASGVGGLFGMAEAYRLMNAKKAFRLAVEADESDHHAD